MTTAALQRQLLKASKEAQVFSHLLQHISSAGRLPGCADKEAGPVYRHELKYLISEAECEAIRIRMKPVFHMDPNARNGEYMIRSLYFDDLFMSAYEEKDLGVNSRHKYRIRCYECSDRYINLERKKKVNQYIYKESAPLTKEEVGMILNGEYGFLLKSSHPLLREFYFECTSRMMRPRVIVDYDREPFILDEGTVRVTFDHAVRAGLESFDIFNPDLPTIDVLEAGQLVMEVKFTEFLPQIVRTICQPKASMQTAVSKYCLCYDKTQYLNGYGYWEESGQMSL
jgi:hypothetical protein